MCFVENLTDAVGDIANNPFKAVKDGLNDKATLTTLAALAGGYGAYQAGAFGGSGGGLGGLFGGGAGTTASAAGAFVPGVDAMGIGSSAAGLGGSAAAGGAGAGALGGLINKDTVQAGAGVLSGLLQSNAANDAAKRAAESSAQADATQRYFYDQSRADNMPALDARNSAIVKMREMLGIGPAQPGGAPAMSPTASLESTPGYQFRLKQGQDQLTGAMNARGMRNSGAMLKETTRYGQDYASNEYDKEINRLSVAGGMGQTGAGTIANAGLNAGNNLSNNALGLGSVRADNALAQGNIYGNTLNSLAGWYLNKQEKP